MLEDRTELVDGLNNAQYTRQFVGTLTTVDTRERKTSEEVACWYSLIECPPQTIDLWYTDQGSEHIGGRMVGTVTAAYYPSLFGGVPYGKHIPPKEHPNVGKEQSISIGGYSYEFAPWVIAELAKGSTIELSPFGTEKLTASQDFHDKLQSDYMHENHVLCSAFHTVTTPDAYRGDLEEHYIEEASRIAHRRGY